MTALHKAKPNHISSIAILHIRDQNGRFLEHDNDIVRKFLVLKTALIIVVKKNLIMPSENQRKTCSINTMTELIQNNEKMTR